MRRATGGSFSGDSFYKVRKKSTGEFWQTQYRNSHWQEAGKVYKSLQGAQTAARHVPSRQAARSDIEIVEFCAVEVNTHTF